ncbi:MAG: hypothetical protein IPF97_00350 [Sphingomonadales bacterium]|jgi:hypothetical protein|nr:hypothetical protein [Sphingomonadales bacterium]MBK6721459.1 hypothetical protein [Sphingomonadales bacterium]MBK7284866.1 hypothetical protein [Sphingomonadales bacterium]
MWFILAGLSFGVVPVDEAAWRSEKGAVMHRWRNKVYCDYKTLMARGEL